MPSSRPAGRPGCTAVCEVWGSDAKSPGERIASLWRAVENDNLTRRAMLHNAHTPRWAREDGWASSILNESVSSRGSSTRTHERSICIGHTPQQIATVSRRCIHMAAMVYVVIVLHVRGMVCTRMYPHKLGEVPPQPFMTQSIHGAVRPGGNRNKSVTSDTTQQMATASCQYTNMSGMLSAHICIRASLNMCTFLSSSRCARFFRNLI